MSANVLYLKIINSVIDVCHIRMLVFPPIGKTFPMRICTLPAIFRLPGTIAKGLLFPYQTNWTYPQFVPFNLD